ncbi:EXS family-domain-containing protein [Cladochytrium replicatum]|nr:EXS family-domain-containing protein [Cladochytrium replicatum]
MPKSTFLRPLLAVLSLIFLLFWGIDLSRAVSAYFWSLPLYFRVLFFFNLAIWCWASNVHILALAGIDSVLVLNDASIPITPFVPVAIVRSTSNPGYVGKVSGVMLSSSGRKLKLEDDEVDLFGSGKDLATFVVPSQNPQQLTSVANRKFASNLYKIAIAYSAVTAVAVTLFYQFLGVHGLKIAEWVPLLTYAILLGITLLPTNHFFGAERRMFLRSFARTAFGTLQSEVPFSDVLLADILTSFSRVIGDLQLVVMDLMFSEDHEMDHIRHSSHASTAGTGSSARKRRSLVDSIVFAMESTVPTSTLNKRGDSPTPLPQLSSRTPAGTESTPSTSAPDALTPMGDGSSFSSGGPQAVTFSDIVIHFLICLPFLFRLRQCIAEFTQTHDPAARSRHFANALKYLSAIPVITSSFVINYLRVAYHGMALGDEQVENIKFRLNTAVTLWICFSVINSLFSLYWDVYMDWNLGKIPQSKSSIALDDENSQFPCFLRPIRFFSRTWLYYLAIVVDTVLRLAWVVKVTLFYELVEVTLLHGDNYDTRISVGGGENMAEGGLAALVVVDFALKILEVFRRWAWVFFRVEREWVIRGLGGAGK